MWVIHYVMTSIHARLRCREPQAVCDSHFKSLPEDIKQRLLFKLEDINDTDVLSILAKLNFQTLLIFCNNLAFTQGTLNRSGAFLDPGDHWLNRDILNKSIYRIPIVSCLTWLSRSEKPLMARFPSM